MAEHFQTPVNTLNNLNFNPIFPKSIAGRTKCPSGPHVARVFETPRLKAEV